MTTPRTKKPAPPVEVTTSLSPENEATTSLSPEPDLTAPVTPAQRVYDLQTLLDNGVQPFDNLTEDELTALVEDIREHGLGNPIKVGRDGTLYEGHQRVGALLRLGHTTISGDDVRVNLSVTKKNADLRAVAENMLRRHMDAKAKGVLARRLQTERNWSQETIAQAMGVTQQAVSKWLKANDSAAPAFITGLDGKSYPSGPPNLTRSKNNPWRKEGPGFRALASAHRVLTSPSATALDDLTSDQITKLEDMLGDLEAALEQFVDLVGQAGEAEQS